MRAPSGEKAAETHLPSCPLSTAISAPLAASHSRAVLSNRRGHDARAVGREGGGAHSTLMSAEHGDLCPAGGIPQPRRAVVEAVTMRVPSGEKAAEDT